MTAKVKANFYHFEDEDGRLLANLGTYSIQNIIENKVLEGDLRGTVCQLMSSDKFAQRTPKTLAIPFCRVHLIAFTVTPGDVTLALVTI